MMNNLNDKIVLVTGASRGIGKSMSLELAKCGAHVILSARNIQKLEEVKNEIVENRGKATIIPVDLAEELS